MGDERSRYRRGYHSLPTMRLLFHRISADDTQIHDAGIGRRSFGTQDYSKGILLPGLPLYLDRPGRAHDRASLASFLSGSGAGENELKHWRRVSPLDPAAEKSRLVD